nr:hypothetical protein [Tanacetum cinerariifolium]
VVAAIEKARLYLGKGGEIMSLLPGHIFPAKRVAASFSRPFSKESTFYTHEEFIEMFPFRNIDELYIVEVFI